MHDHETKIGMADKIEMCKSCKSNKVFSIHVLDTSSYNIWEYQIFALYGNCCGAAQMFNRRAKIKISNFWKSHTKQ